MNKSISPLELTIDAQYLAEVVHELRSPLGGIDAMAELLASTSLTGDQQRLVDGLRAAAQHLRAIADDVLDTSALGKGAFKWKEDAFSLSALLGPIAIAAESRAAAKGLWFTLELDKRLPEKITADGRCIRQMVENLLDNAIKVTTTGQIILSVKPLETRDEFVAIQFNVRDTGPGFNDEDRKALFRPFSRLDNGVAGSGLGLSMVNRMARAMGGETGCESVLGKGALFWFSICVRDSGMARKAKASAINRLVIGEVKTQHCILVVDDNATNRQIMQVMLEHFDCRALEAESGEKALEMLAKHSFSAVMMDQTLPGMSGLETIAAIRASQTPWSSIPVIPVTGRVSGSDKAAFKKAGAVGFVEKPVTARSIKAALDLALPFQEELLAQAALPQIVSAA